MEVRVKLSLRKSSESNQDLIGVRGGAETGKRCWPCQKEILFKVSTIYCHIVFFVERKRII